MKKYIITGGPGTGKTTLLQALHKNGFCISEEVPRKLIQKFMDSEPEKLPWKNFSLFAKCVEDEMIAEHQKANENNITTFFDRGLPDILAYLERGNLRPSADLLLRIDRYRYEPLVFMAPPWQEIYIQDSERLETFSESENLYAALKKAYNACGFRIVELPRSSVEERMNFIQNNLAESS